MALTAFVQMLETTAVRIQRSLGTRAASGYLRNRGVPLAFALRLLAHR